MLTEKEVTWIATLFDCEGCLDEFSKYRYVRIQIVHGSKDVIDRLHALLPAWSNTYRPYYKRSGTYNYTKKDGTVSHYDYANGKPAYKWILSKREYVELFFELIWNEWISDYRRETAIKLGVDPMTKHPHRLMLVNKKTWRCTLEGCNFFVHTGLAHVLPGKVAVCFECGEQFRVDDEALKEDMVRCETCRSLTPPEVQPEPEIVKEEESDVITRTPEQQRAYEREMVQMFGKEWRKLLE